MIWTAITYSTANEKIECQVFEGPMDFQNAYGTIASTTNGIVLSLIKRQSPGGCLYPPN